MYWTWRIRRSPGPSVRLNDEVVAHQVARSRQACQYDGPASVSPRLPDGRQPSRGHQRCRHESREALEETRKAISWPTLEVAATAGRTIRKKTGRTSTTIDLLRFLLRYLRQKDLRCRWSATRPSWAAARGSVSTIQECVNRRSERKGDHGITPMKDYWRASGARG